MDSFVAAAVARASDARQRGPRIWLVSDVHAEYADNMEWLRKLGANPQHCNDVLIIAGDVAVELDVMRQVFEPLVAGFAAVFYTPGNHDLWTKTRTQPSSPSPTRPAGSATLWSSSNPDLRGGSRPCSPASPGRQDSLEKLQDIFDLCEQLGVHTQPAFIAGALIVPILGWYHSSWDTEPDVVGWNGIPAPNLVMRDFFMCRWPAPLNASDESVAKHLDEMNDTQDATLEQRVRQMQAEHPDAPLITFSHFVPRIELNPEKCANPCRLPRLAGRVSAV